MSERLRETVTGSYMSPRPAARWTNRRKATRARKRGAGFIAAVIVIISVAVTVVVAMTHTSGIGLSTQAVRYLGVYEPDAPSSYTGINRFAQAIDKQPNLVSYYSPWLEPFQLGFATSAAAHGALTVVQMDAQVGTTSIPLESIAAGQYDAYLRTYAVAVRGFGGRVIVSFGHEMNGYWYSWGHERTSPAIFVAAWRHIVTVFRAAGASNVTWLWTVNVTDQTTLIPDPAPWWPGRSYVDWVGIDGYYYSPSSNFAQVFGPTIVDVRTLTNAPILIAETGAGPDADQQAKITDLFTGVRTYGLLGFLWFDEKYQDQDWRISSPEVLATFRQDAREFFKPATPAPVQQGPSPGNSSS
jgi:Glycosyl hydrolase family 26